MTEARFIFLQHRLLSLGNVFSLGSAICFDELYKAVQAYREHFKPYNPRKQGYNRYGLSLTSADGGFSGVPDLDSLYEYNKLNGTQFDEPDFRKKTSFFKDCPSLKKVIAPFDKCMGRSHILRLDRGGFFPPHRDLSPAGSFRLFIPLCGPDAYIFILDEKRVSFQMCQMYFINTLLSHSLFSFKDDSLFAVFNIDLSEEAVHAVFNNLHTY